MRWQRACLQLAHSAHLELVPDVVVQPGKGTIPRSPKVLLPTCLGEGSPTRIDYRQEGYPYSKSGRGYCRCELKISFLKNMKSQQLQPVKISKGFMTLTM